jgi:uncharacterized protein (DUF433 family)
MNVVVCDPGILGGTPCFAGTRVPVRVLFENLEDGVGLDEILDEYPSIKREQAVEILRQANALVESDARADAGRPHTIKEQLLWAFYRAGLLSVPPNCPTDRTGGETGRESP